MAIRTHCESCRATLDVPEKYAGGRAKCPQCGAVLTIPDLDIEARPPLAPAPVSARLPGRIPKTLWLLASTAVCVGTLLAAGYLLGGHVQADRWSSVDQQVADLRETAESALKSADQLRSDFAALGKARADTIESDKKAAADLERKEKYGAAELLHARRARLLSDQKNAMMAGLMMGSVDNGGIHALHPPTLELAAHLGGRIGTAAQAEMDRRELEAIRKVIGSNGIEVLSADQLAFLEQAGGDSEQMAKAEMNKRLTKTGFEEWEKRAQFDKRK
jgi:hypothetical protein